MKVHEKRGLGRESYFENAGEKLFWEGIDNFYFAWGPTLHDTMDYFCELDF